MHVVDYHDALCMDVDINTLNTDNVSHLWQLLTQMQYYYTIMSLCVLKLTFMHVVDYHDALCMDVDINSLNTDDVSHLWQLLTQMQYYQKN